MVEGEREREREREDTHAEGIRSETSLKYRVGKVREFKFLENKVHPS